MLISFFSLPLLLHVLLPPCNVWLTLYSGFGSEIMVCDWYRSLLVALEYGTGSSFSAAFETTNIGMRLVPSTRSTYNTGTGPSFPALC